MTRLMLAVFVNRVFNRFGSGASARNVREQGDRKRRPRPRRSCANRFSYEMQAWDLRTQGDRIGWQAA